MLPCHHKARVRLSLICSLPPNADKALVAIIRLPLFRSVSSLWALTLIERPWSSTILSHLNCLHKNMIERAKPINPHFNLGIIN